MRLIVVVFVASTIGVMTYFNSHEVGLLIMMVYVVLYWIVIRAIIWVYDGFLND